MYVKIFSDILQSSIWAEAPDTKVVWITILALSNKDGLVRATAPGISHEARVPLDRTIEILNLLESPDQHSRTPDNDGRRIERADGGYIILNYAKYRDMRDEETRREQWREASRRHYEKRKKLINPHPSSSILITSHPPSAHTDADASSEAVKNPPNPPKGGKVCEVPQAFIEFWLLYPRKVGKKAALRAWMEAKVGDELAGKILEAVKAQKTWPQWTKEGGKYIPHPRTWLCQGRWDDAPDVSGPVRPGTCSYPVEEPHGF